MINKVFNYNNYIIEFTKKNEQLIDIEIKTHNTIYTSYINYSIIPQILVELGYSINNLFDNLNKENLSFSNEELNIIIDILIGNQKIKRSIEINNFQSKIRDKCTLNILDAIYIEPIPIFTKIAIGYISGGYERIIPFQFIIDKIGLFDFVLLKCTNDYNNNCIITNGISNYYLKNKDLEIWVKKTENIKITIYNCDVPNISVYAYI